MLQENTLSGFLILIPFFVKFQRKNCFYTNFDFSVELREKEIGKQMERTVG